MLHAESNSEFPTHRAQLLNKRQQTASERRAHTRVKVPATAELEVELHGFDEDGRRVDIVGVTLNVSRGGLLALIEEKLGEEAPCLGHFPESGGKIYPEYAPGKVMRLGSEDKRYVVAVKFDKPLESVGLPEDEERETERSRQSQVDVRGLTPRSELAQPFPMLVRAALSSRSTSSPRDLRCG